MHVEWGDLGEDSSCPDRDWAGYRPYLAPLSNFPEVELNQTHNQMSCIVLCMTNRSHALHRLRAIQCEQRAREAPDPASQREWEELAVEWHLMANLTAVAAGEISHMEVGWQ